MQPSEEYKKEYLANLNKILKEVNRNPLCLKIFTEELKK